MDKHFIKEKLDSSLICILYVSTQNQLADILTSINFERIISMLRIENTHTSEECQKCVVYYVF